MDYRENIVENELNKHNMLTNINGGGGSSLYFNSSL